MAQPPALEVGAAEARLWLHFVQGFDRQKVPIVGGIEALGCRAGLQTGQPEGLA